MPWRESCAVDQRVKFIADQRSGLWTMAELCDRYEISRKTGYKWLERYRLEGPRACGTFPRRTGAWARDATAHRGCDCGSAA